MSDRITIDPAICHGKPCIRGMRYPVENVLEWLASGMSIDEILADYEDLEREDADPSAIWYSTDQVMQRLNALRKDA